MPSTANGSDMSGSREVLEQAPAAALAMAEAAMADTIGLVMHNAVTAQRNMQTLANAAVAVTCALIIAKGAAPAK